MQANKKRAQALQQQAEKARLAALKALPSKVFRKRKQLKVVNGIRTLEYASNQWMASAADGNLFAMKQMIEQGQDINQRDKVRLCWGVSVHILAIWTV